MSKKGWGMSEFFPFAALIGIAILEIFLSGSWSRVYFRHGIPVYSKDVQCYSITSSTAVADTLAERLTRGWGPSQVFHSLSESEVAFREKAFEFTFFHYTPIMHGLITVLPRQRTAVVKGFLNWFVVAFGILVVGTELTTAPANFAWYEGRSSYFHILLAKFV
jgi:hypothetical protein